MSRICATDSNCLQNAPICDKLKNLCVQCQSTSDCDTGSSCVNASCKKIPACQVDLNCVSYEPYTKCNKQTGDVSGQCVGCLNNQQCQVNETCSNSRCVATITNCSTDNDCSGDNTCIFGVCTSSKPSWIAIIIAILLLIGITIIVVVYARKSK